MAGLMTYTSPAAAGLGAAAEMVRDIWGARRQQREDQKAEELRKLQLEQMGLQQALTKAQLEDLPAQRALRDQQQAMQQWQAMQQALGEDVFNSPEAIGLGEKAGMKFTREFDPATTAQVGKALELGPGITPGGTNALTQQVAPKQTINPRTGIATPSHVLDRQAKDARADYASRLQIGEAERAIQQRQARQDFLQSQRGPLSAEGARSWAALGGNPSEYWNLDPVGTAAREAGARAAAQWGAELRKLEWLQKNPQVSVQERITVARAIHADASQQVEFAQRQLLQLQTALGRLDAVAVRTAGSDGGMIFTASPEQISQAMGPDWKGQKTYEDAKAALEASYGQLKAIYDAALRARNEATRSMQEMLGVPDVRPGMPQLRPTSSRGTAPREQTATPTGTSGIGARAGALLGGG